MDFCQRVYFDSLNSPSPLSPKIFLDPPLIFWGRVEPIENSSTVRKYTLGHDRSWFSALLSLLLKSAMFLPDCLPIDLVKCKKGYFHHFSKYCYFWTNIAIFRTGFCIEQIENGSRVHKYKVGHDRSCFSALLRLALNSAIF